MTLAQALAVIGLGMDIASGRLTDKVEIAHRLVALGVDLIPVEELAPFLAEASRRRADTIADIAEDIKVGA